MRTHGKAKAYRGFRGRARRGEFSEPMTKDGSAPRAEKNSNDIRGAPTGAGRGAAEPTRSGKTGQEQTNR